STHWAFSAHCPMQSYTGSMLVQSIMSWAHVDGSMHCISILAQPSQQGPTPPVAVDDAGPALELLTTVTTPPPEPPMALELAGPLLSPPAPSGEIGPDEHAPPIANAANAAPITHARPSHLIGASSGMAYYLVSPKNRQIRAAVERRRPRICSKR